MEFLLDYWYLHLPNYILAVLIYTLLGRFVLGFLLPPDSENYIWRFFQRITNPVLRVMDYVIPGYIVPFFRPLAAMFHLYVLRVALWLLFYSQGLAPRLGPGGQGIS